jgi:hypothetical protein
MDGVSFVAGSVFVFTFAKVKITVSAPRVKRFPGLFVVKLRDQRSPQYIVMAQRFSHN